MSLASRIALRKASWAGIWALTWSLLSRPPLAAAGNTIDPEEASPSSRFKTKVIASGWISSTCSNLFFAMILHCKLERVRTITVQ
jgi:hypothetical protein